METDLAKLTALRGRLTEEQKRLIGAAAAIDTLPPTALLTHIADLESTIVAVDALIDEVEGERAAG